MIDPWLPFDLVLVCGIVWIGWSCLAVADAFRMVVLFMVFGLLVALAWVRLEAPDVALAEAAVGAGVTGALLLRTIRAMRRPFGAGEASDATRTVAGLMATAMSAVLAFVLIVMPPAGSGYIPGVAANLDDSGVSNPVTAVLLNFRAWDTFLEVVVLVAAMATVWMLGPARDTAAPAPLGPIFDTFARAVLPLAAILAGYLLWRGAAAPGGAFQAGAVLGAAGIVLLAGRLYLPRARETGLWMSLFVVGAAGFAIAGIATAVLTGTLLAYPDGADKTWIIAIEAVLTLSIAAILAGLFHGAIRGEDR